MVRSLRSAFRLPSRRSAGPDRLAVAGLGLLLLAVVAAASRAAEGTLPSPAGVGLVVMTLAAETILLCALVAALVMLVLNVLALFPLPRNRIQPRPASFLRTVLSGLLLLAVAYAFGLWRALQRHNGLGTSPRGGAGFRPFTPTPGTLFHTGYEWLPVLVTVILVMTAGWLSVTRLRALPSSARAPVSPMPAEAAASVALEAALRAIHESEDPRQAVIGAYLELERRLAQHGLARRGPETPAEYLARTLGSLQTLTTPLQRLTELFEVARFSEHPVGENARREAESALEAVRHGLSAAPAVA